MIPTKCIEEINHWLYQRVYCWVSGGKDSTALVLALYDQQVEIEGEIFLIHTNTGLRPKSATLTLQKLKKHTKFPFIELKASFPRKANLLIESFKQLEKAEKARKQGKYDRRVFPCCEQLKHKPGKEFIKSTPKRQRERYVFLSAITRYESQRRAWFLNDLAKKGTYIIWNKKMHAFYGYPFRDLFAPKETETFLRAHGFGETRHSGCRICPILILFDLYEEEPERWVRSKRFMLTHVKNLKICVQTTLEEVLCEN